MSSAVLQSFGNLSIFGFRTVFFWYGLFFGVTAQPCISAALVITNVFMYSDRVWKSVPPPVIYF